MTLPWVHSQRKHCILQCLTSIGLYFFSSIFSAISFMCIGVAWGRALVGAPIFCEVYVCVCVCVCVCENVCACADMCYVFLICILRKPNQLIIVISFIMLHMYSLHYSDSSTIFRTLLSNSLLTYIANGNKRL